MNNFIYKENVNEKVNNVTSKSMPQIALYQGNFGPDKRPAENFEKIKQQLHMAAKQGANLLLFPEQSLSGFTFDKNDIIRRLQETTPEMIQELCELAKELKIATIVGLLEASPYPQKAYNVSLAIGPDGAQKRYHKIHICPNESFAQAEKNPGPVIADFGFVRVGLTVCYDNWFPETARMAFMAGAELLHVPFFWPAEWEVVDDIPRQRTARDDEEILKARRKRLLKVFPGRALDNALYVATVDHADKNEKLDRHMPGKSMVFDPNGELIAETQGWNEEMLYFDFDVSRVREWRENRFFTGYNMRPKVYIKAYRKKNCCVAINS